MLCRLGKHLVALKVENILKRLRVCQPLKSIGLLKFPPLPEHIINNFPIKSHYGTLNYKITSKIVSLGNSVSAQNVFLFFKSTYKTMVFF